MRAIGRGSRILVTGGAGTIGAALTLRLRAEGFFVRVLDDLSRGRRERLAGADVELLVGDVRSERSIREACDGVAAIVHLAAVAPGLSGREERLAHDVNVTGTVNLLAAALRADVGRVVIASSAAVYGSRAPYLLSEDVAPHPATAEGVQKAAAELYAHLYHERDGLPICIARIFSTYGAHQGEGVIARFAAAARAGEPLVIHGDGTQTRDFVHIDDVVAALGLALTTPAASGRTFNVASGEAVSVRHIAALVTDIVGGMPPPRYLPAQIGEPHDVRASVAAASATLGFHARVRLREGIADCLGLVPPPRRVNWGPTSRPNAFPEGSGTKRPPADRLFSDRPPSWVVDEDEPEISVEIEEDGQISTVSFRPDEDAEPLISADISVGARP
jgi:UDP-glucose 4-epimerase